MWPDNGVITTLWATYNLKFDIIRAILRIIVRSIPLRDNFHDLRFAIRRFATTTPPMLLHKDIKKPHRK